MFAVGCAFLGFHVGGGYVWMVVSGPFVGFAAAGDGFNGAELQAGEAAFAVVKPFFFAFGKYPDVVDGTDVDTDHAAVAVWADDEFFAERGDFFHERFVHYHSEEFSGCGEVDLPRLPFADCFGEDGDFSECVFADGFLFGFGGRCGQGDVVVRHLDPPCGIEVVAALFCEGGYLACGGAVCSSFGDDGEDVAGV